MIKDSTKQISSLMLQEKLAFLPQFIDTKKNSTHENAQTPHIFAVSTDILILKVFPTIIPYFQLCSLKVFKSIR